jgi:hypothetical protein
MENQITWQQFKKSLLAQPDSYLQFQYAENELVDAAYHLTEIKQAPITSVDCGGKLNTWTEVILQLWEPSEKGVSKPMKASKALSIIDMVEKVMPLNPSAIVKIEYGNADFQARQLLPSQLINNGEDLVVDLCADVTQCKAIGRGESCRTAPGGEECCAPVKTKIPLKNLAVANAACCEPGSGCC